MVKVSISPSHHTHTKTNSVFLVCPVCLLQTNIFLAEYADMVHDVKHWQNEIELNDKLQFF
jgi:hypothetical protein